VPLLVLVFTAGFVLMGFEIAGSRVLAPFFGNSVYVWGSLIGTILAALGLGYAWGGRISDRWPSRRLLGGIGIGAAAGVFIVPYLGPRVCKAIGESSVVWGPILASAVLFLVPGVLFGMVSPFAIRLQARAVETMGRTAGLLYALSTIGSFAGTFVTTFVLIPALGMSVILKILGTAMLVASALTLGTGLRVLMPTAVCLFISYAWFLFPVPAAFSLSYGELIRYEASTPYHHLYVIDDSNGSRYLRFDRYTESQIGPAPGYEGRSAYTKYFHLAPAFAWPLKRVCFIGAGGGIGPREFLQSYPGVKVDCVDIDPEVLRVCQEYFHVPKDHPDLRMIEADGRMFVRRKAEGPWDAVLLDAFTIGGRIPFHLVTKEYFGEIRSRLAPGGILLMNVISAIEGRRAEMFRAVHRTMAEAFGDLPAPAGAAADGPRHVFAFDVHHWSRTTETRNVIFVAARDPLLFETALRRATELTGEGRFREEVQGQLKSRIGQAPDPAAILLTDEHAPVETMPL
jgi:spermidine synthase